MADNNSDNKQTIDQAQQLNDLLMKLKAAIGPKYPQANDYIDSSVNYISDLMQKLNQSQDKDKVTKEIANDLTAKLEAWANKQKQLLDKQKEQTASQTE